MKPIEIHIEGYKIVISEDKNEETKEKEADVIKYVPYPITPTPMTPDMTKYPYVTWTNMDDIRTTSDINTGGTVKGETHIIGE